ncbi:hypothetical protein PSU4_16840 [Pseudonocardia sulfidoxydans NBRC 16205]|uniref:Uncharacterized protein n=1 Tax=Pseudonocardia sulfidoxydans NBRC 16205 TaxID=1223511 RepID=A0A511DD49_9PSEU|nr:hypothetical protein PSU4_16840 [Pseudonocardia sulfidoxydans NBRC 16205]
MVHAGGHAGVDRGSWREGTNRPTDGPVDRAIRDTTSAPRNQRPIWAFPSVDALGAGSRFVSGSGAAATTRR